MTLPVQPLTHHEILRWVGPFTRRGRHVDLAASDRMARRLVFQPLRHAAASVGDAAGLPALTEWLELESLGPEAFRLTRVLTRDDGLCARLQTEGASPGELLERIEAVPARRQFATGPGHVIAFSHRVPVAKGSAAQDADQLILTEATAQVDRLLLKLVVPPVSGSAVVSLLPAPGEPLALPDDMLAVLGRAWTPLLSTGEGWRGSLRLRGNELGRSRSAEAQLKQAAAHLALCLAEPPARYHQRLRAVRWWVVARRSAPLLVSAALVLAAALVHRLPLGEHSAWRMLIFNAPPLMLILFFCLRELPRFEIPPWPRAGTAASWWQGRAQPAALPVGDT